MTSEADQRTAIRRGFERARRFSGWGGFPMSVRDLGPPRPWDYDEVARAALSGASCVLDVDTGGGERLARYGPFACRVVATEGWPPNVLLAARRLHPLNVAVAAARCDSLPFLDRTFDLLLNRHGNIHPPSMARVLRPGGQLLTQQVDPEDWPELRRFFPDKAEWPENALERRADEFERLGARVSGQRHRYRVAYAGLEDLVFNLAVAPWTIPGLNTAADSETLAALAKELTTANGIEMTRALYLLEARWG